MMIIVILPNGLLAPETYRDASEELRAQVCNGCGPQKWRIDVVPDELVGVGISEACNIHDWMYAEGISKSMADAIFLANCQILIRQHHDAHEGMAKRLDKIAKRLRQDAAYAYYRAVDACGDDCFGKEE